MATATKPTKTKPAEKPVSKPAAEKPVAVKGIGINDLAAQLGRTPKSVRASIRRALGGAQVGRGGRYTWKSKNDPAYKALVKTLSATGGSKTETE
jgi:hypothetical protein